MHEIKPHSAHLADLQARRTPTVDERFAALENAQTRTMLAVEALARKDSVRRDDDRRDDDKRDDRRRDDDDDDRRDARVARMIHDAVEHAMRKYDRKRREDDNVGGQEGEAEPMAADDDRKRDDAGAEPENAHCEELREEAEGQHEKDDRRGDSVHQRLARLERNTRSRVLDADYLNALAEKQADWDRVAQMHGQRAGRPLDGERVESYDRRMARVFQKFSPKWQGEDLGALPASVILKNVGPEVRADAVAAAYRADPSPGALQREVRRQDRTGRWISEFVGPVGAPNGALAPFRMQPMRVVSINRRPND